MECTHCYHPWAFAGFPRLPGKIDIDRCCHCGQEVEKVIPPIDLSALIKKDLSGHGEFHPLRSIGRK